jgi:hypothetical protein
MNTPSPSASGDVANPYLPQVPPRAASAERTSADPVPDDLPDDADDDEFEPL